MKPEKAVEAIAFFEELLKEGIITEKDFLEKKNDILNLIEKTQIQETKNSETKEETRMISRTKSVSSVDSKRNSKNVTELTSSENLDQINTSLNDQQKVDTLETFDLSKMEILRKLSASSNQEYNRFTNLDKEFDNEEKMLEFIKFLMEKNQLPLTVNYIVKQEIDLNKNGLLREESLGSSLLRNYWFNYEGKTYLKAVVGPLVKEVNGLKKPLEIDPTKSSPEIASKNLSKLLDITKNFLMILCHSHSLFPEAFRLILKNFYLLLTESEGSRKPHLGLDYSEDALRLFGSFLLLRFICPAVVSPKRYGLIKNEVSTQTQRVLVLISKVLQSIASQVEFEGEKEPYMIPANEFVKCNMPQLMGFFQKLADGTDIDIVRVNSPTLSDKKKDQKKKIKKKIAKDQIQKRI